MRRLWQTRKKHFGAMRFRATSKHAPLAALLLVPLLTTPRFVAAQGKPADSSAAAQVAKAVGTIKSIQADSITVVVESGGEVTAKLIESTKILRVPPGEKDLKNAVALQSQDLQPGDRVLVRGQSSPDAPDAHSITALTVIVMKQVDVATKKQHDLEDWQKRGVGGIVTKVDVATDIVTISSDGSGANRSIAVHIAKETVLRRYAPGSVKFDDAKPEPASAFMAQIKAGDQLRTRGTRSPDGSELKAEEAVAGSFRNIAGIIKALDAASNTITVQDAISKSAVVVKVSSDSQMKKLPPEMAQRIAMRLKAAAGGATGDQPATSGQGQSQSQTQTQSQGQGQGKGQGMANGQAAGVNGGRARYGADAQGRSGGGGNGPPDLQRLVSRLPNSTLADLQKGDVVMIVATEGAGSDAATAITLLAGVEPILTASPNRSASSLLSPWSLSAPGGEGEGAQQ
jgi:hypothetical protein